MFASLRKYLPVGWKHHHLSVCSLPAHQDIIPWRQQNYIFLRQSGVQGKMTEAKPAGHHFFQIYPESTKDISVHEKENVTLVTSLLVSLHLLYNVWFAATKGLATHPPSACFAWCLVCKKIRSHYHRVYVQNGHQVYMQDLVLYHLHSLLRLNLNRSKMKFGFKETFLFGLLEQICLSITFRAVTNYFLAWSNNCLGN